MTTFYFTHTSIVVKLNDINQLRHFAFIIDTSNSEDYMTVLNDKYASVNDVQFNDIDT